MTIEIIPAGQLSLFELADIANREHELARQAAVGMVEHATRAGEALNAAKAQVRHGEWLPWLKKNFDGSIRTAAYWMALASNSQRVANLEEPSLRKAIEAIFPAERDRPIPAPAPRLPAGLYSVLYCDPPWRYEHAPTPSRAVENHYPTMPLDEIVSLNIPAADDAVLFMWATSPKLAESLEVVEAWGFDYRTSMVWVKDQLGMGYYCRSQHELLLISRRGDLPVPHEQARPSSVLQAPRGRHSEKPAEFYGLIEQMYPGHQRVELFARTARDGWDAWGNELAA